MSGKPDNGRQIECMSLPQQSPARDAFDELTEFERDLQRLITGDDAPVGDRSLFDRIDETLARLLELSQADIQLELSETLRVELLQYCLTTVAKLDNARRAGENTEMARRYVAEALLDLEAMRHIIRDAIDHEPLRTLDLGGRERALSKHDAARHVEQWLPRLTVEQRAEMLGTDARTLRRWRDAGDASAPRRAELAVDLAAVLRHSWTDEGVLRWFSRPHPMLDGHAPNDVIDNVDWELRLRDAARAARVLTAT